MNLSSQVSSLELSQRLRELGVKQESLFWWCATEGCPETIVQSDDDRYCESCGMAGDNYSAFTVAELGEMLPPYAFSAQMSEGYQKQRKARWYCTIEDKCSQQLTEYADTEADARAKMLIYLLENGLVTI